MIVPTCAGCGEYFAENDELASVRHGKRFAFDPDLDRVWRICTKCGDWNVLGAAQGTAVGAELRQHLPAPSMSEFSHHPVGSSEVLVIAQREALPGVTDASLRYRTSLLETIVNRKEIWIGLGVTAILSVLDRESSFGPVVYGVVGGVMSGAAWLRWYSRKPVLPRVAMAVTLAYLALVAWSGSWWSLVVWPGFVALHLYDELNLSRTLTLDDGSVVAMRRNPPGMVRIGLNGTESTFRTDNLPGAGIVHGGEALTVLDRLLEYDAFSQGEIEQGWSLLRRNGDLVGLFRALAEVRPDDGGMHTFDDVPPSWRAAMHFALIEQLGTDAERDAVRDQIAAASEVAAIAESLDRRE